MRVYLDRCILSAMYMQKPEIFIREGWHYGDVKRESQATQSVVFNEDTEGERLQMPGERLMDATATIGQRQLFLMRRYVDRQSPVDI